MKRRDQVVFSRLQLGYTEATPGLIIKNQDNNQCLFCNVRLRVEEKIQNETTYAKKMVSTKGKRDTKKT
jgi:hypothetical protein